MAAVYPKQYKSFPVHKNNTEDIDASHVNNLQDEVLAIQQTLGLLPHQDQGLKGKMKQYTWNSVADRLDAIQRGQGTPAVFLQKSADSVPRPATGTKSKTLSFPRPSYDPEGLWNGSTITANRTGWWIITARAKWLNWTPYTKSPYTDREIDIWVGGQQVATNDNLPSPDGNTHQMVTYQNWVTAGQKIEMHLYHDVVGKTLAVGDLHLAACMIREH
ncbi:hypothetical protein EV284_3426 [Streptomyces sp. BK022]|uniref:hypothetical protein n=1 Tax=Streptomyces sp. BK022 TaxID=2512123 RepID=UPI001029B4E4|nr:hypothetical protein [Streptomyces sp. BK022]RZU35943.1 hypothetical protein EV284_3426 [Streptomyces sp. BK022]